MNRKYLNNYPGIFLILVRLDMIKRMYNIKHSIIYIKAMACIVARFLVERCTELMDLHH